VDLAIIVREDLASGEHEVVADRRVGVGVILRSQAVLNHQARQIWRGRAGDTAVVGVLFDEDGHMAKEGCSRRRIWNAKTSQSHYLRRSRSIVIDAECPGSRAGGSRRELSTQRAARTGSQGGGAGALARESSP
jgi:hypothetical protein